MNHKPLHSNDQVLAQLYRQQAGLYEQILQMSDGLSLAISQHGNTETVLGDMSQVMDQIASLDQQLGSLRDQWTSSGCQPSSELAHAIKNVEKLIVALIQQVDVAERSAQKAKNAMVPTLSDENTRRKMRAAYASASRHA